MTAEEKLIAIEKAIQGCWTRFEKRNVAGGLCDINDVVKAIQEAIDDDSFVHQTVAWGVGEGGSPGLSYPEDEEEPPMVDNSLRARLARFKESKS